MSLFIQNKVDLIPYTTMGVRSVAEHFVEISTTEELIEAVKWAKQQSLPSLVLGGGSNVVMPEIFQGLVICNRILGRQIVSELTHEIFLKVGAGELWHSLVSWTVDKGWYGLENLALIPGLVGAAPIQNIGAYGVEVKDVIQRVQYLDKQSLKLVWLSNEECLFGYRDSVFKKHLKDKVIIVAVEFVLSKVSQLQTDYESLKSYLDQKQIEHPSQKELFDAVVAVRSSRLPDPNVLCNSGSFFKNPVVGHEDYERLINQYPELKAYPTPDGYYKIAAGWLIDQTIGKGYRKGVMGTYEQQALVVVHHGGGSSKDVKNFVEEIQSKVAQKFQIQLECEVQLI
jgi:UDP-N-acetylmuramate dehydrogenase